MERFLWSRRLMNTHNFNSNLPCQRVGAAPSEEKGVRGATLTSGGAWQEGCPISIARLQKEIGDVHQQQVAAACN